MEVDSAVHPVESPECGRVVATHLVLGAEFAPSSALGRVRPGQRARVRLAGFPWTEYGTISASVASVAADSVKVTNPPCSFAGSSSERLGRWIEEAATWIGVEAEQVVCPYGEAEKFVHRAAPAIVRLPLEGEARFLLIAGGKRNLLRYSRLTSAPIKSRMGCSDHICAAA